MKKVILALLTAVVTIMSFACGKGSSSPMLPDMNLPGMTNLTSSISPPRALKGNPSKALWGLWDISIDPVTFEVEAIPQRGIEYTVDVVAFLQYPKGTPANMQIIITDKSGWPDEGKLGVRVGFVHPFPGLNQFVGFDVMGVVLGSGHLTSTYDPGVKYSDGDSDLILLNADGYTRWMNPAEFVPDGTILRFVPGYLGTKDLNFISSTIHGYKYYADGLADDESLWGFFQQPANVDDRGAYRPGSVNYREFMIKFPIVSGSPLLKFQYAVIANWVVPDKTLTGDENVIDIPGDYPSSANAQESFLCKVNDNSTLWYEDGESGGNLTLDIEVFDWGGYFLPGNVPNEISKIIVESQNSLIPGGYYEFSNADLLATAQPGTTACSSVFTLDISNCAPTGTTGQEILIFIEQTYGTFSPNPEPPVIGGPLTSYLRFTPKVSDIGPGEDLRVLDPNGGETLWMALEHEIKWFPGNNPNVTTVSIEWVCDELASPEVIVASTENDGSYVWHVVPNVETDTGILTISDASGGPVTDESDNYFSIDLPVWIDFQPEEAINLSTVTWYVPPGSVTYEQDWDEFSPALSQDYDGLVHICWHSEIAIHDSGLGYRQAREVGIRSMDGDTWEGEGGHFFTWGGTAQPQHELRGDYLKLAPAANNTTFIAVWHWKIYFSVDVDHFPNGHNYYNAYTLFNRTYKNHEIMADQDYLYTVSDAYTGAGDGPGIYSYRVNTPNYIWPGSPGNPDPLPTLNILAQNGEVSHSRSWTFENGLLVMAYYTTAGAIKLLRQTDHENDLWDDTEVIFDGAGYTECRNPSICSDPDGRLYAVWTGLNSATNMYELMASMSEPGSDIWSAPIIAASSETPFDEQHISTSSDTVLLPTDDEEYQVLIGYQVGDMVFSQISPKNLWAFLPRQKVSADGNICRDPDTMCLQEPYLYDALFVWSYELIAGPVGEGKYDILYRNGDFETP